LSPEPSTFVFDLDGTLIDSIADLVVAVNSLVAEWGGRPLHHDAVTKMVGEGASLLVSRAFDASGMTGDTAQALPRFLEIYDAILPGATRPYPGVPEMLQSLSPAAPMAVLTNKPTGAAVKILSMLGLDRFFARIVGGDGPFARKPGPDGLLDLAAEAGADPRSTWLVGDSTVDLRTAHAAATRICIVRYGFGFAGFDHSLLRGGEVFADHPADVTAALLGRQHGR
jgi:phosphoglycolate phosphatase